MKAIIVACLLKSAAVCKTIEVQVSWIKTEERCAAAIHEKAKEFPEWKVKSYKCQPA